MSFLIFSEWLLLKEARRRKPAKNVAIDAFIKSVEDLEKDVEKLSKYEKSSSSKKKGKKEDNKKANKDEGEKEEVKDDADSERESDSSSAD